MPDETLATDPETWIYVLRGRPKSAVKIGIARDVEARIATLQTGNPDELHLLASFPGSQAHETALHRYLQAERIRGEWFEGELTEQVVAWAKMCQRVHRKRGVCLAVPEHEASVKHIGLRSVGYAMRIGHRWRDKPEKPAEVVTRFVEPSPPSEEEKAQAAAKYLSLGLVPSLEDVA